MANCKNCGRELKEGEICPSCYPKEGVFRIKRKFSPIYDTIVVIEHMVITIITLIIVLAVLRVETNNMLNAILVFIALLGLVIGIIVYKKYLDANEIIFYEDHFEKKLTLKKTYKQTVQYDDIVDVLYLQNFYQKIFNTACIVIKVKGKSFFKKSIKINNIRNVENIYSNIVEIIQASRGQVS